MRMLRASLLDARSTSQAKISGLISAPYIWISTGQSGAQLDLVKKSRSTSRKVDVMEEHLSDWHVFTSSDRNSYPRVDAPVQVRFSNGEQVEGSSRRYFPRNKLLPTSSITGWRYIKRSSLGGRRYALTLI